MATKGVIPIKREQNNRIYVGGLGGALETKSKQEIAQFFNPFGEILTIELPKNDQGLNRGHAIIEFATHKDAKTASQAMNGFEVSEG